MQATNKTTYDPETEQMMVAQEFSVVVTHILDLPMINMKYLIVCINCEEISLGTYCKRASQLLNTRPIFRSYERFFAQDHNCCCHADYVYALKITTANIYKIFGDDVRVDYIEKDSGHFIEFEPHSGHFDKLVTAPTKYPDMVMTITMV